MNTIVSADGTRIAYATHGDGPPLVLVGGALNDHRSRSSGLGLAQHLAGVRCIAYDRRGRGESDNAPPDKQREIEDLAALVGDGAHVFGMSSGGILALEAAAAGVPITRLAVYEPPYSVDGSRVPPAYAAQLAAHVAAGRHGDAVALFLTDIVGMPAPAVEGMKRAPFWAGLQAMGPSLLHDHAIVGDGAMPAHLARVTLPVLALAGGASPSWMRTSVHTLSERLPSATHRVLDGQTHDVDPAVLAAALTEFFAA